MLLRNIAKVRLQVPHRCVLYKHESELAVRSELTIDLTNAKIAINVVAILTVIGEQI